MIGDERSVLKRHAAADLRRLRWLGFGLPLLGLLCLEAFRFVLVEDVPLQSAEHVALAAIGAVGIVAFAVLMFRLIDRAEAQVLRQNRELTAVNAVSTAVQGELAVEQIIDAALEVVVERTGASEASVVVFNRRPANVPALERRVVRTAHVTAGAVGEQRPHLIEIPLAHGTVMVGRLRLHMPDDVLAPDTLTSATLNNISHQLACSIEIGQLIGHLQRREVEDRGLYDVLLRISSHKPLPETLGVLAQHAREVLDAEAVSLRLTPQSAAIIDVRPEPASAGAFQRGDDGSLIVVAPRPGDSARPEHALGPVRLSLASPEMTFGDVCVTPEPGGHFGEREWAFVHRIAELAVIAIGNSRVRERERQVAILAERERIARELHDSLAQVLGFIHLQLVALRGKVAQVEPQVLAASMAELGEVAQDAYRDVREAILGLHESSRAGRNLFENLRAYVQRYQHQSGVDTSFEADFDEPPSLSPRAEIHVIRVIQETLTNVRKHARARHATVRARIEGTDVVFCVEDDGRGFDVAGATLGQDGGFGLQAMRERMELVGGTLSVESAPGRGTRVFARVPMLPSPASPAVEVFDAAAV